MSLDRLLEHGEKFLEIFYSIDGEDMALEELIRDCKSLIEVFDAIDARAAKLGLERRQYWDLSVADQLDLLAMAPAYDLLRYWR